MTKETFLNTLKYNSITEQDIVSLMKSTNMKAKDKWNMLTDLGLDAEEIFQFYLDNCIDNSIRWEVE